MQGHHGKRFNAQSKLYATVSSFSLILPLEIMKSSGELLENDLFHLWQKISRIKSARNNLRV